MHAAGAACGLVMAGVVRSEKIIRTRWRYCVAPIQFAMHVPKSLYTALISFDGSVVEVVSVTPLLSVVLLVEVVCFDISTAILPQFSMQVPAFDVPAFDDCALPVIGTAPITPSSTAITAA